MALPKINQIDALVELFLVLGINEQNGTGMLRTVLLLGFTALLTACVSGQQEDILQSVVEPQSAQTASIKPLQEPQDEPVESAELGIQPNTDSSRSEFAFDQNVLEPVYRPVTKKTYLINGLASSVESIGYGFTNLSKKIPGSTLHNYASFIESSTLIRAEVTRELKQAYRKDNNVEINLIGISFGANIVTLIAADLDRAKIPVNYLVTMEGPAMVPIRKNVRIADNFSCTNLDCFRTKSRLAWGNKETSYETFKIKTSHIPLANHPLVHNRILQQLNSSPSLILGAQ